MFRIHDFLFVVAGGVASNGGKPSTSGLDLHTVRCVVSTAK
jgi:hypothetical protein